MDFDDHDEAEEEVALSNYNPALGNNSAGDKPPVNTTFAGAVPSDPSPAIRKPPSISRYRECLKNHAVSIGGHAVDGCGEFLPAGDEGSLDALRCAACSCHRNFHRKEVDTAGGEPSSTAVLPAGAAGFHHSPFSPYYRTPAGYLHQYAAAHQHHRAAAPLALPSTSGGAHSREEMEDVSNPMGFVFGSAAGLPPSSSSGKKRFRTKFTQEQKDKMLGFAEAVGWRIQKQDEAAVQQFCNETSVKRHVLKVWMHNNKHTLGSKKP